MSTAHERREEVRAAEREARQQADAEAYARTPRMNVGTVRDRIAEAYRAGEKAAQDRLAEREWTDAELDAAHAAFTAHSGPRRGFNEYNEVTCLECGYALSWPDAPMDGDRRAKRHAAREALAAARTARQEQNR